MAGLAWIPQMPPPMAVHVAVSDGLEDEPGQKVLLRLDGFRYYRNMCNFAAGVFNTLRCASGIGGKGRRLAQPCLAHGPPRQEGQQ